MIDPTDEEARALGRLIWEVFIDWRPITNDMAGSLERATGIPATVWLILEADYLQEDR